MILTVKPSDPISWIAHTLWVILATVIIGVISGSYGAGYAFGLGLMFMRECKQEGWQFEFWKWSKIDSVLDWVFPLIFGGLFLRFIERVMQWLSQL